MSKERRKRKNLVRIILLAAGITLVIAGICQGDFQVTLNKATHICLECIGIG
ncbi:MAG: hypothetical protein HUJ73_01520 [Eubacterium sp.]|nr:hypothetical protein [Eubacterium sp.]